MKTQKSNAARTSRAWGWQLVNFIFSDVDGGGTYHVLTNQEAPMTGTSKSKTVVYNGSVTISNLSGTMPPQSFPLPFTLRFERKAL